MFSSWDDAVRHLKILTNDHRRKVELDKLTAGAWRYIGPRGRRHGTRLVAFICTLNGAELIGLDAISVERACERRNR